MAALVMADTLRRLAYCASELGESLTVEGNGTTVNTKLARNGAVVLAPGTSLTATKGALRECRHDDHLGAVTGPLRRFIIPAEDQHHGTARVIIFARACSSAFFFSTSSAICFRQASA
jgi:hypothetical protein